MIGIGEGKLAYRQKRRRLWRSTVQRPPLCFLFMETCTQLGKWLSVVCETLPWNFHIPVFWSHGYCFCRAYNVTLNIGQPPKPYFLDPDTGSDLTWLQCDAPCVRCLEVTEVQFIVEVNTALLMLWTNAYFLVKWRSYQVLLTENVVHNLANCVLKKPIWWCDIVGVWHPLLPCTDFSSCNDAMLFVVDIFFWILE